MTVNQSTACHTDKIGYAPPPRPPSWLPQPFRPCLPPPSGLQVVDFPVTRAEDDKQYNLGIGRRVYVQIPPHCMMGFSPDDVDSAT